MQTDDRSASSSELMVTVSAAFRSNAGMYRDMGTPLYGCLFERAVDDPTLIELASHGQDGARPVHLLSAVHDLLLRDSSDPLSRFFPTLNDNPASPEQAFPELQRFCRERRSEILSILQSRTVQSTYVERCWSLMPALAFVSKLAGEPLNLIEIGCSAGVLLTYDSYGYAVPGQGIIGCSDAPLILSGHYAGRPSLKIPVIGTRIGIDLHPVNAKSADERRWLLALCLPELREQQLRLSTALEVVAQSEIHLLEGDALDRLPEALASVEGQSVSFIRFAYCTGRPRQRLHCMSNSVKRVESETSFVLALNSREHSTAIMPGAVRWPNQSSGQQARRSTSLSPVMARDKPRAVSSLIQRPTSHPFIGLAECVLPAFLLGLRSRQSGSAKSSGDRTAVTPSPLRAPISVVEHAQRIPAWPRWN